VEESDPGSVLNYVRALTKLRAQTQAFVYGDFEDLDPQHPHVFAYTRTLGSERYLVVENFSSGPVQYTLPRGMKAGTLLLSDLVNSHESNTNRVSLGAWESRIYKQ
jgi:oligo-1,6-glucosidase